MATVTLHDIDDRIMRRLETQARLHGRSVEREIAALLAEAVAMPLSAGERVAIANRIAAMTPKNVPQTDSVLLLREGRDLRA